MRKKITVVRPGAVGDTLLLAPVLRGLEEAACGAFTGTMPQAQILADWNVVTKALDYELEDLRRPSTEGNESAAVLFMRPGQTVEQSFRSAGCRDVFFIDPFPEDPHEHIVDYTARRFGECGLAARPDEAPFEPPAGRAAAGFPEGGVIVLPGSGSKRKNWSLEGFLETARALEKKGREVFWLLGPAESGAGMRRHLPPAVKTLGGLSLPDTAATLAGASLVIGNDSGPVHLAALLGTPTVAVFQAGSPETWAPRGVNVRVAGREGDPPTPPEVIAAAEDLLPP